MKRTPFNAIHHELGAKMVEFAGFEMPIQYKNGIIYEHKAVRTKVGVFDVTHMGEFIIRGNDALNFVQYVTTNDASKLYPGKVQYSAMCYEDGGIVDDLLVYRFDAHFMFVVNAANIEKDFNWLKSNLKGDVVLEDVSDKTALLAVQGPDSLKTLQKLTQVDMSSLEYYTFVNDKLAEVEMTISRTGYTGELGFELYFDWDEQLARKVWNAIFEAGAEFGIEPVGLGSRDTLRLEKGYCLYGNDIDQTTNPLEAGLGWITKLNKGDFIGKEALLKVKEEGINRRLVGFVCNSEKLIPRKGYKLVAEGEIIGNVTSGNLSPILNKPIGMGYVLEKFKEPGTKIGIEARGNLYEAEVIKLPFV